MSVQRRKMEVDEDMAGTSTRTEEKLKAVSTAVNRRKGALQKLKSGRPSAVGERQLRRLIKQAQRRKKKLEKSIERHAVKKSGEAEAAAETATETPAEA